MVDKAKHLQHNVHTSTTSWDYLPIFDRPVFLPAKSEVGLNLQITNSQWSHHILNAFLNAVSSKILKVNLFSLTLKLVVYGNVWVAIRPGSQVDQVDSSRLGFSKSSQVGLLQRHRRNFLAPLVSLQVISSRLEKSTWPKDVKISMLNMNYNKCQKCLHIATAYVFVFQRNSAHSL